MPRFSLFLLALGVLALPPESAEAKIVSKVIAYKDGDVELEGYLVYDDAIEGQRPGVMVVHEWWGLNDYARKRANMLAELGYVAFAADMYGKGVLVNNPKDASKLATGVRSDRAAWMKRAALGLEQLKAAKQTDPKRLAAIGYCFGGSTVLNMALDGMDLAAVVSFHGALPNDLTVEQAKGIKGTMLICHGARDNFIKDEVIQKFRAVLDEAATDYLFEYYGGAVHSFTDPDADKAGVAGLAYDRRSDLRSWASMRQIFEEKFGPKK